ncbi:hypothetical protein AVEN_9220-1, partial [Araneus ventricosus]
MSRHVGKGYKYPEVLRRVNVVEGLNNLFGVLFALRVGAAKCSTIARGLMFCNSQVLVNSSAAERCLTSAASNLASFYAPEGRWKIDDGLNWQPIPIHYLPPYQDKFLSFKGKCPRATSEIMRLRNSEEMQELFQKYQ